MTGWLDAAAKMIIRILSGLSYTKEMFSSAIVETILN